MIDCFVFFLGQLFKSKRSLRTVESRGHHDSDGGSILPISTKSEAKRALFYKARFVYFQRDVWKLEPTIDFFSI